MGERSSRRRQAQVVYDKHKKFQNIGPSVEKLIEEKQISKLLLQAYHYTHQHIFKIRKIVGIDRLWTKGYGVCFVC
jgi:hypothetical protein